MSNLTIVIDDVTLKKARLRALAEGASVNKLLREFLEAYAGVSDRRAAAIDDLIALSRKTGSGHRSGRLTHEELHDRGSAPASLAWKLEELKRKKFPPEGKAERIAKAQAALASIQPTKLTPEQWRGCPEGC